MRKTVTTSASHGSAPERSSRETHASRELELSEAITIRKSTLEDLGAIWRLAALDDRPAPDGDAVLAFVGDELRVAHGLDRGHTVADLFYRTDAVVQLVKLWSTAAAA